VRRLPIRLRLTIAFAGVLAVVLGLGGIVLYTSFEHDLDSVTDTDLAARSNDVAAPVARGASPRVVVLRSGERIAQVYRANGAMLASTPPLVQRRLLTGEQVRRAARSPLRLDRVPTHVGDARVRAVPAADHRFVVAVGEALLRRDRALDRLRQLLLIAGPLALLLATYAGYQVAGAALRPVERMRSRAARLTEHDTTERLPVPATGDEIEALGRTLNQLLERLDAALVRERRLLSDASHELRTPLTVLRTEVQLALRGERDAAELRAALESVEQESARLSRLADDLLVLARADQGRLPVRREPLDAGDLLRAAAARAETSAVRAGRRVVAEAADGAPLADPDRTAQALDNLVANALTHGRGEVRLLARSVDGSVELHVTDGGEGFPDGLLEHAFDRFTRGEPGRSGEGTGLGLAIVAAIARAHGGTVGARNIPEGGADVWISLPEASLRGGPARRLRTTAS
jgi:two-component system OmpR family sensor kinase